MVKEENGISVETASQIWETALATMDAEIRSNAFLPDVKIKSAKLAGYRYSQKVWQFWLNDVNLELKFPQGQGGFKIFSYKILAMRANFDESQILDFGENRKFEIFNPSWDPNFGSLTLNPKFQFWQILDICSI